MLPYRFITVVLIAAGSAFSQAPLVTAGHIHLNSADPDAAIVFWRDVIGASSYSSGNLKGVGMAGATMLMTKKAPSGPTAGSAVDHVAIRVPDLQVVVDRIAKSSYKTWKPKPDVDRLMLEGPDGVRIELVEDSSMYSSMEFSHIHLSSPKPVEMQAWYAKNFGGRPGMAENADSLQFSGTTLTFAQAESALPTADRAVDHIAFEVQSLDAFCRKLADSGIKIDSPAHTDAALNAPVALLTDPWGTRIELVERTAR